MLEKGKINVGEFHILVVTFTIGAAVLALPATAVTFANQDAWISVVFIILFTLFFILCVSYYLQTG